MFLPRDFMNIEYSFRAGKLTRLRPPHQDECCVTARGWREREETRPPRHADSFAPAYRRDRPLRLRAGGRQRLGATPPHRLPGPRPPAAGDYAAQSLTGTRRAALLGACARARVPRRDTPSEEAE